MNSTSAKAVAARVASAVKTWKRIVCVLCIVFLRRAVLRGPTGETVGGAAADGRSSKCDGRIRYRYEGGSGEEECDCPVVEKSQQYGKGNNHESRHGCDKALAIRRPPLSRLPISVSLTPEQGFKLSLQILRQHVL